MQAEVALTQLDPIGEHLVIVVDLVGEFADIFQPFLATLPLQTTGLVDDTIDEGGDAADERYLRPLFKIQSLSILHTQSLHSQFLTPLFKQIVGDILTSVLTVHVIKQPQREQQQYNGDDHCDHHQVQLYGGLIILAGTSL